MINRNQETIIRNQLNIFPVIAITGPRQSGKTTLAKKIGANYEYHNLENLTTKRVAIQDPVGFIDSIKGPAIIDEIQKIPELLSQIQYVVDQTNKPGQFIITGSESLLLSEKISQSLAGRVVNNTLLPLSYEELKVAGFIKDNLNEQILKGFYPRIYDTAQTLSDFYPEYINTYVEKDVRQIKNIGDLVIFEKFLELLAGRVGQLLNLTSLSNDLGVSHTTIESWISVLESSFIAYRLQPYFSNIGKRLTKSPKIYFYDTGVLCYLLGINSTEELQRHFANGSIFENFVINEFIKRKHNHKLNSKLYFYRDSNNMEVDLLIDSGLKKLGIEIKSSQTYTSSFTKGLDSLKGVFGDDFSGAFIYRGDQIHTVNGYELTNIDNWNALLRGIE